jgi:iron(III) transport system substrate-binding protein
MKGGARIPAIQGKSPGFTSIRFQPNKEKEMKAFVKIMTLIVLLSLLASCGGTPATTVVPPPPTSVVPGTSVPPTEIPLTANEQWAKDNGVGPYQPATDDWAAIEAAAKKEGKVTVYANSGGVEDLPDAWYALYPDIEFDVADTDGIDTKMQAEQESGNVIGDVWFNSDGHILYGKFVPNQWMWPFVPRDVSIPELTPDYPFAIARHSTDLIGYNNKVNPDGCPLTNIWQLTEPQYKNKFFMKDPISDVSSMAKMATFIQHADEMAQAYLDLYGKEWTTDALAVTDTNGIKVENAGYLWIKKVAYNGPVVLDDGDMVDAAFAGLELPAGVDPGYGWTGYSSYEATLAGELNMAPCFGMKPVMGIFKTSFLGIATNAPHPNAAKLFIRFILSDAGFAPWNELGSYSGAVGVGVNADNMPIEELKAQVWEMDPIFDWEHVSIFRDFWAASLLTAPK